MERSINPLFNVQEKQKEMMIINPYRFSKEIPLTISDIVLWLDASKIVGLSDGDYLNTWEDKSGNGRNATKMSNAPVYKTNIQNGLPSIKFSNNFDGMYGNLPTLSQPITVIVVIPEITTSILPDGVMRFFDTRWDSGNYNGILLFTYDDGTTRSYRFYAGTELYKNQSPRNYPDLDKYYVAVFNGASSTLRQNGEQIASGNVGSHSMKTNYSIAGVASINTGNGVKGYISEIIVYGKAWSSDEITIIETYIKNKYNY